MLDLDHIYQRSVSHQPVRPLFWFRYIDDCMAALPSTSVDDFRNHLNSQHRNIQFTCEQQQDNRINFLDMTIRIKPDQSLSFSVFRKASNSGKFLEYDSYHTTYQKRNVVLALKNRAKKICSDMTTSEENRTINDELKSNGYPSKFLRNTKIKDNHGQHLTPDNVKYVSAPYVKGASEKIGKLLSSYNIITSKSSNTLKRTFCHLKDMVKKEDTSEIVYEVKCSDCEKVYIGESGRELGTRIKEHQGNINKREINSQIYKHLEESGHANFDWNNVKVLGRSSKKDSRLFLESSFTYVNVNSINRCDDMPDQYKPTISNILSKTPNSS